MASPSEYLSNVWQQYVPQGHDKPLKQAVYTTISNLFILVAIIALVAVYFILEAFLRPLLWALLCGTFLYPMKRSLTNVIRRWMKGLRSSGTPIAVGIALLPVTVLDSSSNALSDQIQRNFKIIIGIAVGLPVVYLLYHFGPLQHIFGIFNFLLWFLYELIGYFSSIWIWTIFVAYILLLFVYWTPESHETLSYVAIPVWVIFIIHVATIAGPLRVPLLITMIAIMIIGFVTDVNANKSQTETETEDIKEQIEEEKLIGVTEAKIDTNWSFKRLTEKPSDTTPTDIAEKPKSLQFSSPPSSLTKLPQQLTPQGPSLTSQCFMALIWGHVLVRLWMHLWIIILILILPFVLMLFKKLGATVSSEGMLGEKIQFLKKTVSDWFESRQDVLVPRSIRGLIKLGLRGDGKIIKVLEDGIDKMTSILLILALLIGTVLFTVLGAIQIHQESMLMVTMTSTLLNDTLHPELSQWLPNSEDMTDAMDSMVGNAYIYGRDWIASKVRDLVDDGTANSTHIEQQVLEVWDRLYDSWFSKNTTSLSKPGVDVHFPDFSNISAVWEFVSRGDGLFDVSSAVTFVQDNIGTFMSVLDSVWMVLKGNMNLISSLVTAIISMVLGGGTAILNFVISAVIFLTTLFYLLASSGKTYKPVEWFTSMSPSQGGQSGFGQAVEEAISSVFMASLKMSAFYGLYTWLTHVLFDVDIVFIPSVLAAIFGAVPFVGTYWAAFPGVLELWVLKGQGVMAIVLLVFHMLPAYVVDTAIYSEIKGGHPFMTGLTIAGGMYWLGLEGAFIGPILLCCLIVVVNMYSTMIKPEPITPSAGYPIQTPRLRSLKMQDLKRSVSTDGVPLR
ncbi:transmembrane protein 245 isoform X2 [Patella vulgata]|uniref:transmembrane protein 245 isoform X2 n=1 Tax=Patella vulgata TaxID=6465 RepID=UPI0021809061|nr:transmembrane protein 245 isoform X2 [Patella vulgata]